MDGYAIINIDDISQAIIQSLPCMLIAKGTTTKGKPLGFECRQLGSQGVVPDAMKLAN